MPTNSEASFTNVCLDNNAPGNELSVHEQPEPEPQGLFGEPGYGTVKVYPEPLQFHVPTGDERNSAVCHCASITLTFKKKAPPRNF